MILQTHAAFLGQVQGRRPSFPCDIPWEAIGAVLVLVWVIKGQHLGS